MSQISPVVKFPQQLRSLRCMPPHHFSQDLLMSAFGAKADRTAVGPFNF